MFRPLLLALALLVVSTASFASQLSVSPVRVDLPNSKSIVPVTVYNGGDETVVMETTMRIWNQSSTSGQWLLSPTKDVQSYPGLIRILPKSSAVVRVGLSPGATVGAQQGTYRLFLRELADPRPSTGANVRMILNINLPVFVGGAGALQSKSETALTATVRSAGVVNFTYQNPKDASTLVPQLATYTWLDSKGKQIASTQGKIDAYALPGGVGRWNETVPVECKLISTVSIKGEQGVLFVAPLTCPQ